MDAIRSLLARMDRWTGRHRVVRLTRRTLTTFIDTDSIHYAAGIAYFALLSLFQLAVLGIIVLSYVLGEVRARAVIIDQLIEFTPLEPDDAVEIVSNVLQAHAGIGFLAVPLLVLGGLGLFFALQRGVLRAFHTEDQTPILRQQLVNVGLMALVGAMLVASLVIGLVVGVIQQVIEFVDLPGGALFGWLIGLVVPFSLAFVALVMIYRYIPVQRVGMHAIWPAALLAAVAWTALQAALSVYATRVADYADVFGPISSAVSLVVFVFATSVIVLLGAALAHALLVDSRPRE